MSEIYALTSAPLLGVIHRTIGDERASTNVLKSVYARVWELRGQDENAVSNPLNRLRALAHRYALDYKIKHGLKPAKGPTVSTSDLKSRESLLADGLSDKEYMLLKLAYLNAMPIASLAKSNNCSVEEMERRIQNTLSKIRRAKT